MNSPEVSALCCVVINETLFYPGCVFVLQMNATNDGDYVFFTGQQNYKDFSRVSLWKGERYSKQVFLLEYSSTYLYFKLKLIWKPGLNNPYQLLDCGFFSSFFFIMPL